VPILFLFVGEFCDGTQSGDHHPYIGRFSQIWLQAKYESKKI
jgi:hypothetical protein